MKLLKGEDRNVVMKQRILMTLLRNDVGIESAIAITAKDWKIIVPIFNTTEQSSSPSAVK
jgi:hypothetical protein